ncbi:hypothetical protein MGH68_00660 [Erysipelothrix sp. D19-032]
MSQGLVVIIDEVHRLNKDKQDVLLPHIESGLITMIGATTANPYFSINPRIRSRVHLFEFNQIDTTHLEVVLKRAFKHYPDKSIDDDVIATIAKSANGDARYALNALEILTKSTLDTDLTKTKILTHFLYP